MSNGIKTSNASKFGPFNTNNYREKTVNILKTLIVVFLDVGQSNHRSNIKTTSAFASERKAMTNELQYHNYGIKFWKTTTIMLFVDIAFII